MTSAAPREPGKSDSDGIGRDSLQRFLNEVVEAIPGPVAVKRASDLSYIFVNKAARELISPGVDALGKTDRDLFGPRKARRIQADDERVLASRVAGQLIEEEQETARGIRTFCTQKIPMVGVDGTPDVLITFWEDITAQSQLLSRTEMWEQVFSHAGGGMVVGRPDGTTLELMNSAFALLFGSTLEDLSGCPLLDIFEPSVHETVISALELVRANGQHRFETVCRRANGTTFPAVIDATSAKDAEGKVHYRVIRVQDISLLKSEERALRHDRDEAERANAAKSLFVAGMSHELRTPLNVILSFGQVLQREASTPIQAESVGHVLQAARHLLAVIDEALDMSTMAASGGALSVEPVRVTTIVDSVLALMQPLAETAGVRMVNESRNSRVCALADRHRLQQVLLNVITNAINYNIAGGAVQVRVARRGQTVTISVIDSGLGLPPGTSRRLFVPFDRLGREQGNVEGTGLGLSLSKALVEAMGGSISASRNSGPGTTFKVALEACPAYGATRGEPHSALADVGRRHPQILFIEDSLASIGLIEEILQLRPSIGVLTAMQAGIGLQLARHHQPGLIILDAYLPDLTGAETARRLAEDPRTRDIPVIMASTEAKPRRGTSSLKNRSRTHLTKPIESRELLAAIDDLFGPGREFGLPGKGED